MTQTEIIAKMRELGAEHMALRLSYWDLMMQKGMYSALDDIAVSRHAVSAALTQLCTDLEAAGPFTPSPEDKSIYDAAVKWQNAKYDFQKAMTRARKTCTVISKTPSWLLDAIRNQSAASAAFMAAIYPQTVAP